MSRVSEISSTNYPSMKRFGSILLGLAALAAPLTPASAVVTLYNNSNITTGVGNGLNGANTSAIALGDSAYGFTDNGVTLTYALADDFTLSTASQVTQVTFDAYSTSTYPSPPTSPFTAATVSIWNAQPGTAGATVLFTSSTLAATAWTGVYRVQSTTLTNAQRPVFTLSVSFNNVPLVAGSYWASWSVTGVGSPGSTASIFDPPLMNTDGTQPTGNAIQSTDGGSTWAATADASSGATNRLPLAIVGNAVPEPAPAVWMALAGVLMTVVIRRRRPMQPV